jgi:hypothetical protein
MNRIPRAVFTTEFREEAVEDASRGVAGLGAADASCVGAPSVERGGL